VVAAWTTSLPADEIEAACVQHDVPVATAYTAADMFADPHFAARGDLIEVEDPVIGKVRQQAPFPRFVGEAAATPTGAPVLGADTDQVLSEVLGLDSREIERLRADGTV
jgi:crotonobetainyl-CoA:carnitine CoA-transferase CaiB-like acyl-CoA transferase